MKVRYERENKNKLNNKNQQKYYINRKKRNKKNMQVLKDIGVNFVSAVGVLH